MMILFKRISLLMFLFLGVVLISGCNTTSVYYMSAEKYPPKASNAMVDLYVGEITRPCRSIAVVNSRHYPDQTQEAKAKMLAELRRLAGEIGADAVVNVRMLPKRFEGMVVDEKVPFPAWKPGDYYTYFMRGTAVVYTENQSSDN